MSRNTAVDSEQLDLGALMLRDHERLEARLTGLTASFDTGDPELRARLWAAFREALTEHLELEERNLLPRLAENQPRDTARLLRDHEQLRERMVAVAVGVKLGLCSSECISLFMHLFRSHARREEALMYQWVEHGLAEAERHELREGLKALAADKSGAQPSSSKRRITPGKESETT